MADPVSPAKVALLSNWLANRRTTASSRFAGKGLSRWPMSLERLAAVEVMRCLWSVRLATATQTALEF